ncbi:MAG: serine hydrolase, partial [Bacteroidetes bacterium]|nr:serine hydrolase [Bacteroidota bacterium]
MAWFAGWVIMCAACQPTGPTAPDHMGILETALADTLADYRDATVAVALHDLSSGHRLAIRGDRSFHAASTMKVPVMMEVFRQAEAGAFQLDDSLTVRNAFTSIVDGSTYQIENDSDEGIYARIGEPMAIRDLTERMITRSSNLATNLIIERVTADSVQQTIERLGAERMQVLRGVEDIKAYRQGFNNTATANDLARILGAIAEERIVSPSASAAMIDILQRQEFNDMIPAGLPPGTEVAHKTGWVTEIHHDAAIIYPPDRPPYVLVVLTEGIADRNESAGLVATIARVVAETLQDGAPARATDSDP